MTIRKPYRNGQTKHIPKGTLLPYYQQDKYFEFRTRESK